MKKITELVLILLSVNFSSQAQVVINEIYGGGGNNGSTYKNDFIELYNNSNTPVNLAGWSVQYASSAGSTWSVTALSGSIAANGYYLIQETAGANGTTDLPAPDATGNIAMSATGGKVALVNSVVALMGTCPTGLIDQAGFGASASCYEGNGPAPAPSNINSIQRTPIGTDTQNNEVDFTAGPPSPNNSGGVDLTAPVTVSFFPANSATGIATSFTATITFSESVLKGVAGNILVKKALDNSIIQTIDILGSSVVISGPNVSFPVNGLDLNTSYYIEITNASFKDPANNDFTGISGSSAWSFTTIVSASAAATDTTYNFNNCSSSIPGGFTFYNVSGAEVWSCTTFGRDPANPAGSAAFESAVQINGFSNGTNVQNTDWLISPSFDLTGTTYPLLSFWSRIAFNGPPLQLKVSTDYPGTGDPSGYTWIDLNGKFPAQGSNTWTQSQYINLSAYKSARTYIAFVYYSTAEEGARWTIDDIRLDNSAVPPPASITTNTTDIQYGYVPVSTAAVKSFTVEGNDITGNLSLTSTGNFLVSKTNSGFSNSITYTQAEANNTSQTVYVQFLPVQSNLNYSGTLTVRATGVPDLMVNLSGNSFDTALTLEVVNWNLEWFGSPDLTLGPANKNLQEANVKTITQNINADLFAFAEVVSETRLQNVVANLNNVYGPGTYSYVICNYGSHTNPFEIGAGPLSGAQKEAFVYKTSVISPIGTPGPLVTNGVNTAADLNNPAYNYFSSGRYPFMMNANVKLGSVTKPVRFVLIHAKANTSPTNISYNRRKSGADTLNYTLNNLFPDDNIVLLGDFNDDLDQSITAGFTVSSYSTFNTDISHFVSPTLALSLAGKKSTVSYNDMIDHVELSNEMQPYYMQNTASVLTNVTTLVANYGSTTSDHYPVFTRYSFDAAVLPVSLVQFTVTKQNNTAILNWSTSQEIDSKVFTAERSVDSKNWVVVGSINAAGSSNSGKTYTLTDYSPKKGVNYYRLKQIEKDGKIKYSLIRSVSFSKKGFISISPNPASHYVNISLTRNYPGTVIIDIIDTSGKLVRRLNTSAASFQIDISKYAKGTYMIKAVRGKDIDVRNLLIQ